jgi:pyruvate/2-oxoacid:ferredoxin oxidoreductase beta subunit/Pyruvate/2-oxoacid:ferredoxin oxidoreductase gamma subunit
MSQNQPPTYLDESQLPYLFCPGCGHGKILDALNAALQKLALDPREIVIVTDIGCAGLSDRYFVTNAFHGLHGRSVTYATGIKLANSKLKVIVLIGDGGCGIGGHHLINAARRNIGVTTLVFNNLNYGMTGGEHSVTSPIGSNTSTTRYGQLEHPLNVCGSVAINGASFVARTTTFDEDMPDLIVQGIENDGFSLIDIWELCTAYYVPNNKFSKRALLETLESLQFPTGVLQEKPRPEYSVAYREAHPDRFEELPPLKSIIPEYNHHLAGKYNIIIAGAAGTKISSAATLFGQGAALSGLWVTQRDDYPVTVKSGHSISELILSPKKIRYTGFEKPDLMVVLFPEGLAKSQDRIHLLAEKDRLYISADLLDVETRAKKSIINFKATGSWGRKKEYRALIVLGMILREERIYPLEALRNAISQSQKFVDENMSALDASSKLILQSDQLPH